MTTSKKGEMYGNEFDDFTPEKKSAWHRQQVPERNTGEPTPPPYKVNDDDELSDKPTTSSSDVKSHQPVSSQSNSENMTHAQQALSPYQPNPNPNNDAAMAPNQIMTSYYQQNPSHLVAFAPHPVITQPNPSATNSSNNNTIVINQQKEEKKETIIRQPRLWTSGICDCCADAGICCFGCMCFPCQSCQVATDMGESCCVPCCVPGWLIVLRTKIRAQENISGSVMDDCCASICCAPCAQCQLAREIKFLRARDLARSFQ